MLKFKKVSINLFFILFIAVYSYFAGGRYALIGISFALLHEFGHIAAIVASGKKIEKINIEFFRINIEMSEELSLFEDFFRHFAVRL